MKLKYVFMKDFAKRPSEVFKLNVDEWYSYNRLSFLSKILFNNFSKKRIGVKSEFN